MIMQKTVLKSNRKMGKAARKKKANRLKRQHRGLLKAQKR